MLPELTPIYEPNTPPPILDPNILPEATVLPFSKSVRKQIGARDHWTCQDDECGKSFQAGWMVQAAHLPEHHLKTDPIYDTPQAGEILCIQHHLLQHLAGTDLGPAADAYAAMMLQKTDPHTYQWHKEHDEK